MYVIFNLFLLVFFSYLFYYLACVTVEVCVDQNERESFKKQSFLGTTGGRSSGILSAASEQKE